jgi:hypothetical protein
MGPSPIVRRVLDERALFQGIPDGLLEPRMASLLRRHDLPAPVFQHWVTPDIRVDFAWRQVVKQPDYVARTVLVILSSDVLTNA